MFVIYYCGLCVCGYFLTIREAYPNDLVQPFCPHLLFFVSFENWYIISTRSSARNFSEYSPEVVTRSQRVPGAFVPCHLFVSGFSSATRLLHIFPGRFTKRPGAPLQGLDGKVETNIWGVAHSGGGPRKGCGCWAPPANDRPLLSPAP